MEIYDRIFYSGFAEVDEVVLEAIEALKKLNIQAFEKAEFRINFMLREILNNAVEHGNRFDRTKKVMLKILYRDNVLIFKVKDEGAGIEPLRHGIHDFVLRERNRGYEVIKSFDFDVMLDGSIVEVSLNMNKIR
ncbi:MAG: ATP-binding protein [Clostridia bacterium]|nr:ATP-binding protein [Clostridia bacterium]